jgi:transposase
MSFTKAEQIDDARNHYQMGLTTKYEWKRRFREILLGRRFNRR